MLLANSEMSNYAATLQFLSSLLWPALLLWLLWRFRSQIEQLLLRLTSIKFGGTEFALQPPSDSAEKPSPAAKKALAALPPNSFVPVSDIRTMVEQSDLLGTGETVTGHLLLFQTPAQHTWLIATTNRVFVVLDDAGTRSRGDLIQNVLPRNEVLPVETDIEDGASVVCFPGGDIWWYYSRDLFPTPKSLKDSLENLVRQNA